jgi:hypothetical protein
MTGPGGAAVAGVTSYSTSTRTVTFNPSADLTPGVVYTATVSGAADAAGNVMTPVTWSFTATCPCTIFAASATPTTAASSSTTAIEAGVKFQATVNGRITGVRFYKGSGNTGTHTASLWSSTGTRLATATFSGESSTGWQTVSFSSPVNVTAGTTYVASYYAPNGHTAADVGYFSSAGAGTGPVRALANGVSGPNGVARAGAGFPTLDVGGTNFWVDVIFTTP